MMYSIPEERGIDGAALMAPEVPAGLFTKQNWQLTMKIKVLDVFPSWWKGAE